MKKLKHLALVGDTGYFDKEVNYAGSEALVGVKVVNIKPHVDPFVFPVVLSLSTSCTRCRHHRLCPGTSRLTRFQVCESSFAQCKSSPNMFVATLQVVGASAGGRCCVAPDQKGSAIAALWDQRDIVKSSFRSRTDANKAKSGRHVTIEDSCAPATRRHDGHIQSSWYCWMAGWQIILHLSPSDW